MHYPWWHVPFLTAPMLIAAISVLHVIVSHYAVGGGLFLAAETTYAYRTGNKELLAYLKKHAGFFVLLTVAYGAITGVGIWWTIGLASPLATETLIHAFVFGWAMEYVFFVLEVVSAFIFYYYWGRLTPRTHVTIGWIYAFSAWMSLVLITGITGFMLNPGSWPQEPGFWRGFFNPQLVPQVLARTGGAFLLASLYVYAHAAFTVKDATLRNLIERRSARPALLGAICIVLGGIGWFAFLPDWSRTALLSASALNVMLGIIFGVTVAVFALMYIGPYRNPSWLSPGFAILFLAMGFIAVGTGEFVREAVRKPYVVANVVLSNQVLPAEIPGLKQVGLLDGGRWTHALVASEYPQVMRGDAINEKALLALPERDRLRLGEVLFQYGCSDCHAARYGYSAIGPMITGQTRDMVLETVLHPEKKRVSMPPFPGTAEEASLLTDYLLTTAQPAPTDLDFGMTR